jgi:hypothetical protein
MSENMYQRTKTELIAMDTAEKLIKNYCGIMINKWNVNGDNGEALYDIAKAWITTFSTMIPCSILEKYNKNLNYAILTTEFIRITETRPDANLLSLTQRWIANNQTDINKHCVQQLIILWTKTFSEFPPIEILNNVPRNQKSEQTSELIQRLCRLKNSVNIKYHSEISSILSELEQIINN